MDAPFRQLRRNSICDEFLMVTRSLLGDRGQHWGVRERSGAIWDLRRGVSLICALFKVSNNFKIVGAELICFRAGGGLFRRCGDAASRQKSAVTDVSSLLERCK